MPDQKTHRPAIRLGCRDITVSQFCLGTINWGTKIAGDDLDRLYEAYRNAGGNFFDSAHIYAAWLPNGEGSSERTLADIVRKHGDLDNVIMATKGGHPRVKGWYERGENYLSPEQIQVDVRQSLDRMKIDCIDLYYLHRDDPRVPVNEIIDTLNEHIARGQLSHLGASNWTTKRIAEANDYAARHGKAGFAVSQPKFSLAVANPSSDPTVTEFNQAEQNWHAQSQIPVCAYSPTANGFFATNGQKGAKGWTNPTTLSRLSTCNAIAENTGKTPNQVSLAWLLHQPFPVIPILGTTNVGHLNDALEASKVILTGGHIAQLSQKSV